MRSFTTLVLFFGMSALLPAMSAAATLAGTLTVPAEQTDFSGLGNGASNSRLGGFVSDLYYQRDTDLYYGVTDRGPGGGLVSYVPRIQQFTLNVDGNTGGIAGFQLQQTILLKNSDGSESFDGLAPDLLHGDRSVLGLSLDPESLVVAPNGNFYIGDEIGPALYEFAPQAVGDITEARFVRAFTLPENIVPRDSVGEINYTAERSSSPALISGRQDNRGLEGLALSPDGNTLWAIVQDPLADEGDRSQGRRGRNVRIVRFDVASGESTGQFIYQLEPISDINARIPGSANDFEAKRQGRWLGVSALVALNDRQLLALERDTRGMTPDVPLGENAIVGSKRIYEIDLTGATDVSETSLAGLATLPSSITPVSKSLMIDLQAELVADGQIIPERIEGLVVGPQLADGSYALILGTDSDFSISSDDFGNLSDVYTDGSSGPVGGDAMGRTLIPTFLYSIRADLPGYVAPVPEPSALGLLMMAILAVSGRRLRRWRRS